MSGWDFKEITSLEQRRPEAKCVVLFCYRTIQNAVDARSMGIFIVVIAIGQSIDMIELQGLASQPWSLTIISINSFQQLSLPETLNRVRTTIYDGKIFSTLFII